MLFQLFSQKERPFRFTKRKGVQVVRIQIYTFFWRGNLDPLSFLARGNLNPLSFSTLLTKARNFFLPWNKKRINFEKGNINLNKIGTLAISSVFKWLKTQILQLKTVWPVNYRISLFILYSARDKIYMKIFKQDYQLNYNKVLFFYFYVKFKI